VRLPPPPDAAAWLHLGARSGFEVLFVRQARAEFRLTGCTTGLEDDVPWIVSYEIVVDADWTSRQATISARTSNGSRETILRADGRGAWEIDGRPAPHLDGCLDVDLESSVMTNALPIHRLAFESGEQASIPAAYVRTPDLTVQRLEQRYTRLPDTDAMAHYRYDAPAFDFSCRLTFDGTGFVTDYPGIAVRVR
jgi:uncharacterized protein